MILRTAFFSFALFLLSASSVYAQYEISGNTIPSMLQSITRFIGGVLIPLVFALAFLAFIWGLFLYFIAGGADEEKRAQGKQLAIWGVVGFFVMVSVWGLVNIIRGTFNLNNQVPALPGFTPGQGSGNTPTPSINDDETFF